MSDLGEFHAGEWEGLTIAESGPARGLAAVQSRFARGTRAPGGELMIETQARMVRAAAGAGGRGIRDEMVAVVSHGDPLRAVRGVTIWEFRWTDAAVRNQSGVGERAGTGGMGRRAFCMNRESMTEAMLRCGELFRRRAREAASSRWRFPRNCCRWAAGTTGDDAAAARGQRLPGGAAGASAARRASAS